MIPPPHNPNADLLLLAAERLAPILDQLVFVGGCATGLLITDPAAAPTRPTYDVDAIVEIASYEEFKALEQRLRDLGFEQPPANATLICRWHSQNLVLDIMPTDASILGFSNRWYQGALEHSTKLHLGNHQIRLITSPYFLATKIVAFRGRGRNDYRSSHDLEDIVTVVDGRPEIIAEVRDSDQELRSYLGQELTALLGERDFVEALAGYMLPDFIS